MTDIIKKSIVLQQQQKERWKQSQQHDMKTNQMRKRTKKKNVLHISSGVHTTCKCIVSVIEFARLDDIYVCDCRRFHFNLYYLYACRFNRSLSAN